MQIGQANNFQKEKKILVSTICAYKGRSVPVGVQHLIRTCKKFNIQLAMFGTDRNFTTMWNIKYCHLEECLQSQKDYDWVLNIDCCDVLFIRDLEAIWEHRNEDKVIWAAERNCYPVESLKSKYPECHNSYRFLNGGGFFGKMDLVLECFKNKPLGHADCDQGGHSQNYVAGNSPMVLDHDCKIFQTLWGHSEDDFTYDNTLTNKETGSNPCILHGNGMSYQSPVYKKFI